MARYDLVIQLGSQVMYSPAGYQLAPHTAMRTEASAIAVRKGIAQNLMISGGSNFGVRYDDQQLLKPANFSFAAFADADFSRKSEAAVIKDFLVNDYGVESSRIFAETLSATTEENAAFVAFILKRRPAFTGNEKIAVLTLLYHMDKALKAFTDVGLEVEPLFAENVLADQDPVWIDKLCDYYGTPKGGKQYRVDTIRQLLTNSKSLTALWDLPDEPLDPSRRNPFKIPATIDAYSFEMRLQETVSTYLGGPVSKEDALSWLRDWQAENPT